jgi:hypothetical protein
MLSDRYGSCRLDITLAEGQVEVESDASYLDYCTEDIYLGRPRRGYYNELRTLYPDSIFIQINDVFIRLSAISSVIEHMDLEYCHRKTRNINIHADRGIPADFLQRVLELVPDSVDVHSVIRTDQTKTGLRKIKR